MNIAGLFDGNIFSWVVLPLLIFVSRIFDVSLGTIRIIFVSSRNKMLAPILGFFEVLIWVVAISQIMQNLNNVICFVAYAAGFSTGTFVGIMLEEKLALGTLVVRIILVKNECKLIERLTGEGFGVTSLDAKGANGYVKLIYTVIKRKDLMRVEEIINKCNSRSFYSIEEARTVREGIFPSTNKMGVFTGIFPGRARKYQRHGK